VPAANAFPYDMPHTRFQGLEAFRHTQMEIEKAMIYGAHGNAHAETVFDTLGLRIARH